jgi:hypothetical protein
MEGYQMFTIFHPKKIEVKKTAAPAPPKEKAPEKVKREPKEQKEPKVKAEAAKVKDDDEIF